MRLTSPVFRDNEKIPAKFTCDGEGISPSLEIYDVPDNAKSLVLIMDDPDIPEAVKKNYGIEVWDHWLVFNMPPDVRVVEEGVNPPGILGKNTRGNMAYGGPCPPDGEHRYFLKLYALDAVLDISPGSTKAEVEKAMEGHMLEKAELVGRYKRG